MVVAAAVVVAAVAWSATTGLLQVASAAKDPAAAQVEAIKTGLSIAAGTGGVFALLLAVRRQWHQEVSAAADSAHRFGLVRGPSSCRVDRWTVSPPGNPRQRSLDRT
jgi:hypothetical protein